MEFKTSFGQTKSAESPLPNLVNVQDVINNQLKQYYSVISQDRENQVKIRNWMITLWLAYVALISSGKISFDKHTGFAILSFIIGIFWVLEALQLAMTLVSNNRVHALERLLSQKELPAQVSSTLFYQSGYITVPMKDKIRYLIRALFLSESVIFFYPAMFSCSAFLSYYLTPVTLNNSHPN